jgi:peptide/nickel transport system permease protein
MGLRAYIAKRIVYCFALVCAIIIFDYLLFMQMGNPVEIFLPPKAGIPQEQYNEYVKGLLKRWGLDKPLHIQVYSALVNMLTFNFGRSYRTQIDIPTEIAKRLPYTILLLGTSTTASIIIGLVLGIIAAHRRGSAFDTTSVTTSLIFYSLPTFWIGLMLILIFAIQLRWLPTGGACPSDEWMRTGWPTPYQMSSISTFNGLHFYLTMNANDIWRLISGYITHLILPFATLTLFMYGGYLLLTRAVMIDVLTEDYIVTARAKGVEERNVLLKHALKNASLPIITSVALSYAFMISGAVITETVFNYPGMGGWIWYAIVYYDYGVLMPIFYVIALCVIAANFIADLLYGIIDPRIKYG